ncbi:MAG: cupin domain-containing protein [Aphanocapsa sp. GSE-SYN-MK-11-07L]|nr:cupin domain-containing protein [Aphanocapsa sp. GSE-SYN-MK-11-07L]
MKRIVICLACVLSFMVGGFIFSSFQVQQPVQAQAVLAQTPIVNPSPVPKDLNAVWNPLAIAGIQSGNGIVRFGKAENFPLLQDTTVARVDVQPGASRTPHWHNSWELQICLNGKAKTFLVDKNGNKYEGQLEPGLVSFVPEGWLHWFENNGNTPVAMMFAWPSENVQTFELAQAASRVTPKVLSQSLGIPEQKINGELRLVVP